MGLVQANPKWTGLCFELASLQMVLGFGPICLVAKLRCTRFSTFLGSPMPMFLPTAAITITFGHKAMQCVGFPRPKHPLVLIGIF